LLPLFRLVPVRRLLRDQFRSDQRIARVTVPLLITHGSRDPVIPIALGYRCFSRLTVPPVWCMVPA
jgi:pimeloyl-ACP methyl ester carboxylesterase